MPNHLSHQLFLIEAEMRAVLAAGTVAENPIARWADQLRTLAGTPDPTPTPDPIADPEGYARLLEDRLRQAEQERNTYRAQRDAATAALARIADSICEY